MKEGTTTPPGDIRERLPFMTKLAFGAGDLGTAMTAMIMSFFHLFFLTTVAGLNPAVAGAILMTVKVVDAVTDPLVGWLSDNTRSRYGKRRSWMLYGTAPFVISFTLLWVVPPLTETGTLIYYLAVAMFFSVAYTSVNIPYTALTPELTDQYDERTSLNTFRFAFSIGGSLLAGILHQAIVTIGCGDPHHCLGEELRSGYLLAGVIIAVCSAPATLWCVAGTRERVRPTQIAPPLSLSRQVRAVLRNRPYRFVIGIYICSWLAVQFTSAVIPFYVTFWLRRADLLMVIILAVQGSALLWLFLWNIISTRIGKKAVYMVGMTAWLGVQAGLFLVQPEQVTLAIGLAVLAGVGLATAYLVPWSMMPDVIEINELETGHRMEGIAYGGMVFLQKLGIALALFLVGVVLTWLGFDKDALVGAQPESALWAIRAMIGPVPALVLVAGMVLADGYPITRQKHAALLRQIQQRQKALQGNP